MASAGKNCEAVCRTRIGMLVVLLLIVATLVATPSRAVFVPFGSNSSSPLPFRIGYYDQSCPQAETIVSNALATRFTADVKAPAQLIRMLFHECFVTGCDASLLENSTATNQAEKTASPNLSVGSFDLIDLAKASLEAACPGIVSCADIQVLIARDAVNMLGGPFFQVPTGRLDTRTATTAAQAASTLPSHTDSAPQAYAVFQAQGFSLQDFVTLMGAHTVGATFCQTFSYRLYNYQNTSLPDPKMDPKLVTALKGTCPNPNTTVFPDPAVALDQGTINTMDISYYQQLQLGHGILEVDQNLGMDNLTGSLVTAYAGTGSTAPSLQFLSNFANAIVNLGTLNVITGNTSRGSIRQNCAILN